MWEESIIFMLIYLGVFFILPDKVKRRILGNPILCLMALMPLILAICGVYTLKKDEGFQMSGCGSSTVDCADQNAATPYCLINEKTLPTSDVDQTVILNVYGRYVRVYPSTSYGDGYLGLSQVVVNDATGTNIALNKPTTAISTFTGTVPVTSIVNGVSTTTSMNSLAASSVVDGTLTLRPWPVWNNNGGRTDYWQVDLGSVQMVTTVRVIVRANAHETVGIAERRDTDRTTGTRVVVLQTPDDTITKTGTCMANPTITYPSGTTEAEKAAIGPMILQGMNGSVALNIYRALGGSPPSTFTPYGFTDAQSAAAILKLYRDNLLADRMAGRISDSLYYSKTNTVKALASMAGVASANINVAGELTKYMNAHVKTASSVTVINGVETITQVSDGGKEQTTNAIMTILAPNTVDPSTGYSRATAATRASVTTGAVRAGPDTSSWSRTATANAEQQQVPIPSAANLTGQTTTGTQIDTSAGALGGLAGLLGFSSPSSGQLTPQWYFVTANTGSAMALTQCSNFGGKLATLEQITEAQQNGASVQQWGWYGDTADTVNPTTIAYPRNVVYSSTNIASVQSGGNWIGVNCFGIKPPKGTTNVAPWTDTAKVANTCTYVAGDWSMRVGGDGGVERNESGMAMVPGTPLRTQEVYWVGFKYAFSHTKDDAQSICRAAGGDLATLSQLTAAWEAGAQWCSAGWVKDAVNPQYPMKQKIAACGDKAGVIDVGSMTLSGANCVGVKQSKTPAMMTLPNNDLTQTVTVNKPGRYVRVRGSLSGSGWFHFSQIIVKNATGTVISQGKPTFYNTPTTSSPGYSNSGTAPSIAVDGTDAPRPWGTGGVFHSYASSKDDDTQYWEVDLGSSQQISTITYHGRSDSHLDRISGTRIEISQTPVPLPFSTYSAPHSWSESTYFNTTNCAENTTSTTCNGQSVCLQDGKNCSTCPGSMETYGGISVCDTGRNRPIPSCPPGSIQTSECSDSEMCARTSGDPPTVKCAGLFAPLTIRTDLAPRDMPLPDFIEKCNITMSLTNKLAMFDSALSVDAGLTMEKPGITYALPAITYTSSTDGTTKRTCCYGGTPILKPLHLLDSRGVAKGYYDRKVTMYKGGTRPYSDINGYNSYTWAQMVDAETRNIPINFSTIYGINNNNGSASIGDDYVCPAPGGSLCAESYFYAFRVRLSNLYKSRPVNALCMSGLCDPTTYLCADCQSDSDCRGTGHKCITNTCKKPDGASCSAGSECINNNCNDRRCSSTTTKALGVACTADSECVLNTCTNNICSLKRNGATCTSDRDCEGNVCYNNICNLKPDGAACTAASQCTTNKCYDNICGLKAYGTECTANNECADGACSERTKTCVQCNGNADCSGRTASQCAGERCYVPADGPCNNNSDCVNFSCYNNRCQVKPAGAPCSSRLECSNLFCDNNICSKVLAGGACSANSDCKDNVCVNNKCSMITLKRTGERCYSPSECASGRCAGLRGSFCQ